MSQRLGFWLSELAAYAVLAAVVYTPWALGGKPVWAEHYLEIIALIGTALWLGSLLAKPRRPATPWLAIGCAAALMLIGWGMTANAHSKYDVASADFTSIHAPLPSL